MHARACMHAVDHTYTLELYMHMRAHVRTCTQYMSILENATALGSRIPPHAVLLHVNNTPVKLKIIFAI